MFHVCKNERELKFPEYPPCIILGRIYSHTSMHAHIHTHKVDRHIHTCARKHVHTHTYTHRQTERQAHTHDTQRDLEEIRELIHSPTTHLPSVLLWF